jgi:hypothetical protein
VRFKNQDATTATSAARHATVKVMGRLRATSPAVVLAGRAGMQHQVFRDSATS